MKHFVIIISLASAFLQFACSPKKASETESKPTSYSIIGKITGLEGHKMLYLFNKEGDFYIDSCLIQNGEFSLKGKQNDPVNAVLIVGNKNDRSSLKSFPFYLNNANYILKTTYDNFEKALLEGNSKPNMDFAHYRKVVGKFKEEIYALSSLRMESEMKGEDKEKYQELYKEASMKFRTARKKYVQENPNTYPALDVYLEYSEMNEQWKKYADLRGALIREMSNDELKACYQKLSQEMKNSSKGKTLYNSLYFPDLMEGDQYVELEDTYTMDGKAFKISDLKTDYVLLDFTGIYCGACKVFNKKMKPEYDKIKDKLTIVAFYTDADKEGIIKSTQKDGIKWMVVSDFKGKNSPNMKRYKIHGIPDFYLLDKDRKIVKHKLGGGDEFIKYLLSLN